MVYGKREPERRRKSEIKPKVQRANVISGLIRPVNHIWNSNRILVPTDRARLIQNQLVCHVHSDCFGPER